MKVFRAWVMLGMVVAMLPQAFAFEVGERSLWITGGGDTAGTRQMSVDLEIAYKGGSALSLSFGRTRIEAATRKLDADSYRAGWSGSQGNLRYGIDLEYWKDEGDAITSKTTTLQLGWQGARTGVTLLPQYRVVDLALLGGSRRDTDSIGIGVAIDHRFNRDWRVQLSAWQYDYDINMRVLSLRPVIRRISRRALAWTSGLYDSQRKLGLTWQQDRYAVDVSVEETRSAVDGTRSRVWLIGLDWNLDRRWALRLEAGTVVQLSDDSEDSVASLGIGYYW